ncbi:MAG: ChbG/HpnK family deacetylase [Candidatus Woesearchaeota archaeon]
MKYLIINADDFGYSRVFNEEIIRLIGKGLITSTTVMIDRIDQAERSHIENILDLAKTHDLSIGLHVEFTSDKNFRREIERQFAVYKSIFSGIPSHLDLHKSTYLIDGYPYVMNFCHERKIPCRNEGIVGVKPLMTKKQAFDGTYNPLPEVMHWLKSLTDDEMAEIFFHPGRYDPDCKSSLNRQREEDVKRLELLDGFFKSHDFNLVSYNRMNSDD